MLKESAVLTETLWDISDLLFVKNIDYKYSKSCLDMLKYI